MYKPIYENDGKDKAVSPIIATILIVAITVVLAATLYAVISGYGGIIGKSTPSAGVTVSTTGSTATVTVNSVGGNLSMKNLKIQVTFSDKSVGSAAVKTASPLATNVTADTFALTVTGGGGYLTGLTTIVITASTTATTSITVSSFKIVDTSTNGVVTSWPS